MSDNHNDFGPLQVAASENSATPLINTHGADKSLADLAIRVLAIKKMQTNPHSPGTAAVIIPLFSTRARSEEESERERIKDYEANSIREYEFGLNVMARVFNLPREAIKQYLSYALRDHNAVNISLNHEDYIGKYSYEMNNDLNDIAARLGLSFEQSRRILEATARKVAGFPKGKSRAQKIVTTDQSEPSPKPARPQFRERTGNYLNLSPPEFIKKVYAAEREAGTLHKGLIHRHDPGLYTDLHNWLRDPQNRMPDDLDLPTYHEWNSRRRADPVVQETLRLQEVERGRQRRRVGTAQRPPGRPRKPADSSQTMG